MNIEYNHYYYAVCMNITTILNNDIQTEKVVLTISCTGEEAPGSCVHNITKLLVLKTDFNIF